MKAQSTVLQAVLIFSVLVSLAIVAAPWAYDTLQGGFDASEIDKVKSEFTKCAQKILETARTGAGNRCVFSVSRGDLEVRPDGIYYTIISRYPVCSGYPWRPIDSGKRLWESCEADGVTRYSMRFMYPESDAILLSGDVVVRTPTGEETYSLVQKGFLMIQFSPNATMKGKSLELVRYRSSENTTVIKITVR